MVTYKKAKENIELLNKYIYLIENYNIQSLEDLIIYQYAIHNSFSKVIKNIKQINSDNIIKLEILTTDYVRQIILKKPRTELHSLVKQEYLIKTRPKRRKSHNT